MTDFGDYIVYVDESGDHGLKTVNPKYPIFCLAFCVFEINDYVNNVVPAFQQLKFDYWGHDAVILHEYEIRNQYGEDYRIPRYGKTRQRFLNDVTSLLKAVDFSIIANVQNKHGMDKNADVYGASLKACMVALLQFLQFQGLKKEVVHLIFESRGKKEDAELELVFRQICHGILRGTEEFLKTEIKFVIRFAKKATNSTGLQIADLVARPIGLNHLRPDQSNRAYDVIKDKIYQKPK